jgi:anti-sigma factor RsiW
VRCEEYELWLSAYLDGELAAADLSRLEGHVVSCDRCARELAALRTEVRLTRALAPEEPPADLHARIMAALDTAQPSLWSRLALLLRAPSLRPALGLSALGATAALVGLVALHRPGAPTGQVAQLGPTSTPRARATAPTQGSPPVHLVQAPRHPSQHTAPTPKREGPDAEAERAQPSASQAEATPQLAERPAPAVHEEPTAPRVQPETAAAARAHRVLHRRSRPSRSEFQMAERPRMRPAHPAALNGMTPAPPTPGDGPSASGPSDSAAGDLVSAASANVTPDPGADDAVTMMASMPAMPSGAEMDSTPENGDDLSALRQRLATQRRELPSISVGGVRRSRRGIPPTFEF